MMKIFLFDGRRLRPRVSPFYAGVLSTSGLNELYVTINKNDYVVLLNGRNIAQISNRNLGKSMAHRNKFNRIVKARATSTLPIKRLVVAEGGRVKRWARNANDPNCGYTFEIPSSAASARDKATAKNFEDYEGGKCITRRDNINFNIAAAHVVGGVKSIPGQFPWLVSLRFDHYGTVTHECGASLINRKWAVSAAHCFASDYVAKNYQVYVGDYSVANDDYNKERTHRTTIAQYLAEEVPSYNEFRSPICLPTSSQQFGEGDCCQVAGWGKTASNQADLDRFIEMDQQCARKTPGYSPLYTKDTPLVPDTPRFTYQEIFPGNECASLMRGRMDTSGAQFCASKRLECNLMADTCQGDSGGPFFCKEPGTFDSEEPSITMNGASYKLANTDRAVLWGITSSGGSYNSAGEHTGCGDATGDSKGAGIYTNVASYMEWIMGVFRKNRFSPSG
ncbi:Oidioi.mRNA.OKI2018_I69.PAR.g12058.t1.cds [Oikopleura dioica]|uniref:Oidioi.mRNA.OKI2018_I69.PAR.g12058.t1.cds n=1 Tax=Oikopleura dioica TaxID=34765 RepID=A0ABN7S259_OIKDI|nr:Oidioi.mRNA.OKI2018_I69.PAR.g12058.t1.cds [Oikopleura dioica]